jgi:hypothetical protein
MTEHPERRVRADRVGRGRSSSTNSTSASRDSVYVVADYAYSPKDITVVEFDDAVRMRPALH